MDQEKLDKLIDVVYKQLALKEDMSRSFLVAAFDMIKAFDENHAEKGGLEPYTEFGPIGVMIEFAKKYNKLKSHYQPGDETKYDSEELEQIWEACAVYSLMGKLVESGDWTDQ